MSFDEQSLHRLRELGRKLPQPLPINKKKGPSNPSKLHPVETEEDPETLFRELINISEGGEVPSHLINRLKEIEAQKLNQCHTNKISPSTSHPKTKTQSPIDPEKQAETLLYQTFQQLLLEDEEEI